MKKKNDQRIIFIEANSIDPFPAKQRKIKIALKEEKLIRAIFKRLFRPLVRYVIKIK